MATIKSYTDISQSKKLLALGVSPESADMCYFERIAFIEGTPKVGYKEGITDGIPCWSLSALLDLMPADCGIDKESNKYVASYVAPHSVLEWDGNTPLEAAFNMVCWLINNNCIKTEKI